MDAALIVLDGWGLGTDNGRDAVAAAETPTFDRLAAAGATGKLEVAGRRVGLPDGQMGNSEVGHLNIGAGRVVYQEYTRISDSIADGSFRENDAINTAFENARDNDGRIHFVGLVSDGGVHADQEHLHALIELAADREVEAVTHAITDGRDTSPTGGREYLRELESVVAEHGTGHVATVSGRYYAMDRDQNWERTKRAYDAIVDRRAEYEADSAVAAVEESYDRGETDEFVEPTLVTDQPALQDGDSVVWFNFRSDRARQLTRMLADIRPEDWADEFETSPPDTEVVMLTQYDKTFDLPIAYPPNQPENVLGEVLADAGNTQLRIAESEKYAHVTYFLNGGREVEFDGEIREIVESPDVPTYDLQPEMSAPEVTDTAISIVESDDPDVLVLNYANPDMVGHTGDYEAAIAAVEAVDEQLGRLTDALESAGADVLITADHGNADDMGTEDEPHTAHTYNEVPLVYVASDGTDGGRAVREGGTLADIAPTMLELIGIDQPPEMTGESLLE
ncbi:phosphoglycerate mutase, 2,3-biphosphateglycerate-independent type [Natrialba magadii ATCC 43099]|uniref:2,3-bisphosphoglycerate-independent phosphoglycerate mutase n=1 Tax=Natrialba magadii (strain ATCC 43099 / DSM 3394 / CCM 3739 / CIP 104546 / IAM 13178 / JCM 8861 / NBRC 102185 / NCIMB 2190 / MS3) TaxID=547559 RepID=D3SWU9_NATMM|nr:2,3-bisphosphoglycerate-independent phosphoglycerate mutase [Natrialba magadii]ADD05831.1 phosphoglycerate mutase, 2,3-biphosphateglycerate-independent type [Natrialba magadii ATCC 43099]ELY30093.1 phosphoglyceromutase [Natrialba magadii ATCC 43099]